MHTGHYMFMFLAYIFTWIISIVIFKVVTYNCPKEGYCSDGFGTRLFLGFVMAMLVMIPFFGIPIFLIYSFVNLLQIQSFIIKIVLTALLSYIIIPIILPYEFVTTVLITSKLTGTS